MFGWMRKTYDDAPKEAAYIFDIGEGDKLLLKTDLTLSAETAATVRAAWEEFLRSDRKVGLLDSRFTPIVLRRIDRA